MNQKVENLIGYHKEDNSHELHKIFLKNFTKHRKKWDWSVFVKNLLISFLVDWDNVRLFSCIRIDTCFNTIFIHDFSGFRENTLKEYLWVVASGVFNMLSNTKFTVKKILSCYVNIHFLANSILDSLQNTTRTSILNEMYILVKIPKLYMSNPLVKLNVPWLLTEHPLSYIT